MIFQFAEAAHRKASQSQLLVGGRTFTLVTITFILNVNSKAVMEYVSFVTWIFLAGAVVYYLRTRNTVKTWKRERFLRKEEQSLGEAVTRMQKAVTTMNPVPFAAVVVLTLLLVAWTSHKSSYAPDLWKDFTVLLVPLIPMMFLLHRTFKLMLEMAEELYKEELSK